MAGNGNGTHGAPDSQDDNHVIDFSQAREQKLEEKRRKTERIFFTHLLGVYTVTGDRRMLPIEVLDLSEEGVAFQVPHESKQPWPTELVEFPLRLYFTQDTYLEIRAKIQNSRPSIDKNQRYTRYGCAVDASTQSYPAYVQFVRFMKLYAEHAHKDLGDISVFYL